MKPVSNNKGKSVIAYQPPQIDAPQRMTCHFVYVIMYELVLIAALWQHSDPLYTVSLMVLTIPLGLSAYLPYRLLGRWKRFLAQLGVLTLVFGWFIFRLYHGTPLDKVLAESICGIGLCFILAQRVEDYDYLLLISFFMLLYGALIPRAVYILIFIPAFLLMLLLFYASRARALGRRAGLRVPLRYIGRSWFFMALHLTLAAAVAWYIFILFPLERKPGEGVFQVSFVTENDIMNHADSMFWFKSAKLSIRPDARRTVESDGKNAAVTTENKKAPVNPALNSKKNAEDKEHGNAPGNTSEQGTDLVFRVRSPVKLYWVGQIYDFYDGREWTLTKGAVKNRNIPERIISEMVTQQFTLEKWVSHRLFAAYRAQSFEIAQKQRNGFIFEVRNDHLELLQIDFPKTPFRYSANSVLLLPYDKESMGEPPPDYWLEALPRKHFLRLPAGKISERLKEQTATLLEGIEKPYDRAVKLRDFLRGNYPYKLEADPLPEDREMADYFVFELKTGHCEYYAGTLAVMARLAELPSRVVTGFSPGNYNAMTGLFEVHEYHAHAWTQIFIENMGWLTFDATPPSALPSRTTPFGIGSLRDPFGDSWRVTPPEITRETMKYILENREKRFMADGEKLNPAERILLKTAVAPDNIREQINRQFDNLLPNIEGKGLEKARTIAGKSLDWLNAWLAGITGLGGKMLGYTRTRWYVLIPSALMLTALLLGVKIIRQFLRRMIHLSRERRYFMAAYAAENTEEAIRNAYLAVREQLVVIGLPRRRNMELIRYGRYVESRISGTSGHVERIFAAYSRVSYSGRTVADAERERIRESLAVCRKCTYRYSGLDKYFPT